MRTAAVLPVKRFVRAKQRLGASVAERVRRELAGAMVADVLEALSETRSIELTVLVTSQPELLHGATAGTLVVEDTAEAGQSAAATLGIARALQEGFERVLCVPGDCPALDPGELERLIADAQELREPAGARGGARVVGIPDRHGTGTNGLLLCPPDAIAPSFGPGSFARHRTLALAAGADWRVQRPSSLLLDIDTGADLQVLRERLAATDARAPKTRAALAQAQPGRVAS